MRCLVTGGSGFIGSHLVLKLLRQGHDVAATTRHAGRALNLRLWGVDVLEVDVRNRADCRAVSDWQPEVVFHLAGYIHAGQEHDRVEECFLTNALGTANVLDASSAARRFVYVGTSETYGSQEVLPMREDATPRPASPYGIAKFTGELYCRIRHEWARGGPEVVCLRPFNTYGPGQSSKSLIAMAIERCLRGEDVAFTDGRQTRDYVHVDDTVEGILRAGLFARPYTGVVNLATGRETRVADLLHRIRDYVGGASRVLLGVLPHRPTEVWRMVGDPRRAADLLSWRPLIWLEDGLGRTVDWYRERLRAAPEVTT